MRKIIFFILKLLVFYLIWLLINEYLVPNYPRFEFIWYYPQSYLLIELMYISTSILSVGLNLSVEIISQNQFLLEHFKILEIGPPCFGYEVMYYFTVFLISYPGGYCKKKIFMILFGLLLINLLNILRIVGISLLVLYYPQYADFNHHFLFTFIIYTFVFSMWLVWIRYFSTTEDEVIEKADIVV